MPTAEFNLITPLMSLNNAYGNSIKGRRITKKYRAWKDAVCWELKAANQPKIGSPYSVAIEIPCATRADIDNLLKGVLDALVKIGATPDDRKVVDVRIFKSKVKNTIIRISDEI